MPRLPSSEMCRGTDPSNTVIVAFRIPMIHFAAIIFNLPQDKRLYERLTKYGLANAHLMDASVSCLSPPEDDLDQDRRIFLKQIDLITAQAVLVMNKSKAKDGFRLRLLKKVQRYLAGRDFPRVYPIYHYRWTIGSRLPWEKDFSFILEEVVQNHQSLAGAIRLPRD